MRKTTNHTFELKPVVLDDGRHAFIFRHYRAFGVRYWLALPDGETKRFVGLTDMGAERGFKRAMGIPE